ncbi:hypothetical protein I317_05846 [Kwoniella heveanensis CBS 569]|nr:hypothetical protein I317_05846 [Kwoniella heveanensis CBS 569]
MSDIGQPHTHGHAPSSQQDNFDSRLASITRYSHAHTRSGLSQQSQSSSSSAVPMHIDFQNQSQPSSSYAQTRPQRQSSTASQPMYPSISHPGCVLCSLVSSARVSYSAGISRSPAPSPSTATSLLPNVGPGGSGGADPYPQPFGRRSSSFAPSATGGNGMGSVDTGGKEVVFQDGNITIYRAEGKERLCSGGKHLIVVINRHLESVYGLGPSDVPLLGHIIDTSRQILTSSVTSSGEGSSSATASEAERGKGKGKEDDFRVGFVGSVMRDPQCPHKHLHAHAMIGPIDITLPGATFWRRNMVFGGVNWWSIEDLRAEIREETSNNRVKSGYQHRDRAPIDRVPDAGSVAGFPNALEIRSYQDHPSPSSPSGSKSPSHLPPNAINSGGFSQSPMDLKPAGKGKAPESAAPTLQMESTSSRQSQSREPSDEDEGYVAVDLDDAPTSAASTDGGGERKDVGRGGRI